ncbi:FYVE zinc finger-domain-containing protein [Gymnopilus junonius]|uniref:FYVE zinc finger-domain-containing protein n=1 Tax=Gymnopilus junonius TaxID=109634 RepID=A0A9P5NN10_GYMJU|nr:FYVE zinc finger-domain-containing protein [Gymnopilus junonius]
MRHSSSSLRPNEHLAVLLPKQLWKPDSSSTTCDNFYCRVPFSLFERKHHCRKCGAVFCAACTARTTPLLDTSNLDFLQPPRNVSISVYQSPVSPIVHSRVCDDCWDQIHGCPATPHTPELPRPAFKRALSHPISFLIFPSASSSPETPSSPVSTSALSPSSETFIRPVLKQRSHSLRNTPSASSLDTQSSNNSTPPRISRRVGVRASQRALPQDLERSYGELDAYPLRRSSTLCKASGGGRWEPKQSPVLVGYRQPIPGGKAPYEIQMEEEEMLERQRRLNPVVKDGAFQYRFPRDPEPIVMSRSPFNLSTF